MFVFSFIRENNKMTVPIKLEVFISSVYKFSWLFSSAVELLHFS